ncbi:MAG: Gfo/Idh/MocA family oxidoreductase [Pseudomonadota bacterium]
MAPVRWGILGAAKFAQEHMARAIHAAEGAEFAALATSSAEKAAPFQAFAPTITVHESYDALLADASIDAVYIPLPNHMHVEWTLKALDAGKHVLCEKPITLHASEFDQLIAARDRTGLLAAEAYMIVHHPQFEAARKLIDEGDIGELRHVDVVFSFNNELDAGNIRNKPDTGGGGLRDIGVYAFGSARFVTGAEPTEITHADLTLENGVDVIARVGARFPGFSYGAFVSMRLYNRQHICFHGSSGSLTLTCPYNSNVFDQAELILEQPGGVRNVQRWTGVNQYVLQVEAFCRAVHDGSDYACPLEFSRGTQDMMDQVFVKGGVG